MASVVSQLFDAVSGLFLEALGTDMTAMEEYFPFVTKAYDVMQVTAWAILILITIWQLFRAFGGPITEAENPWHLLVRSSVYGLLIGYAKPIFSLCLNIARAPYTTLMELSMTAEDFTFAGVEQTLTNGLLTIVSAATVVGLILILILEIALGWNYFKLLLETVERYIVVGVLCYTSPLAFSMGGSKTTSTVFKSWCRMVGSQLLLLVMNVWFLRGFASSMGQFIANGGALTTGKGSIDKARDKFLDLVESLKTGRYLTDKIQGVEKHSGLGEPRAVIFHGDYKVIIMASMIVDLPKDLRGQDPYEVYHYLLTKRLGSEIDYVVKGIDRNTGLAVGSRKDAMATKRRHYYLNQTRDGTYRIYEGLCCEARVMSVIPYGIFVDLFGIDVYIPLRELSYVRLTDAMGYYEPGDRVLVKVTQLNRDDPDDIRVAASVKQVAANPVDKALEKIEVNSNYAGTVTLTDSTGIFVRLDMGAECRCRFPYRARPPKGARVVVKIAGVDMEQKTVWGNITYVTIPK